MNQHTEAEALVNHFPALAGVGPGRRTDAARALGVVSLCLGCGTVVSCGLKDEEPTPEPFLTFEQYRAAYSAFLRADDPDALSCCDDADTILY